MFKGGLVQESVIKPMAGASLWYETRGDGGDELIIVHGWSCNSRFFAPQLEAFSKTNRCIAMDLAGHGRSGSDRDDWTVGTYAADVCAVLESAGVEQGVLVGHSMGGAVVLEAARRCPQRVKGVVLVDLHVFDYGHIPEEEREAILGPMREDLTAFIEGLVANTLPESAGPELAAWVRAEMAVAVPERAVPSFDSLLTWDARPALDALDIPVCAINGSLLNETARARYQDKMTEWVMPEAGHFPQLEMPDVFNQKLAEVLKALD